MVEIDDHESQLQGLKQRDSRISETGRMLDQYMHKLPLEVRRLIWRHLARGIEERREKTHDFDPLPGKYLCEQLNAQSVPYHFDNHEAAGHDHILHLLSDRHRILAREDYGREYFDELLRSEPCFFKINGRLFSAESDDDSIIDPIVGAMETWTQFLRYRGQYDSMRTLGILVEEADGSWPYFREHVEPILSWLYDSNMNYPLEKMVFRVQFATDLRCYDTFEFSLKDTEESRRDVLGQIERKDETLKANIAIDQNYGVKDVFSTVEDGDDYFLRTQRDISWTKIITDYRLYANWICDQMKDLKEECSRDKEEIDRERIEGIK